MATMLSARGVTFGYAEQPLIEEWDADFADGELVAITGPSGCGKSTLLYILGLMLRPQRGTIRVAGREAATLSDRRKARLRASTFGFVFQDAALDAGRTVLDNVTEGALYRGQSRAALTGAALELIERFGVGMRASAKPTQISGGQAQRIALCRALIGRPDIILADEPTGNLDSRSTEVVFAALADQAAAGTTVVIVTHDAELAAACETRIELT